MRTFSDGIDHVVIVVGDLESAAQDYRKLGFLPTPKGRHTMGSENHCVMFASDYFELLGFPPGARAAQALLDFARRGSGLAAVVLRTSDAQAMRDELNADGISASDIRDFSRPVDLDGEVVQARFRTVDMPASLTPGLHMFACQHYTREATWRRGYCEHPNGVTGLKDVILISDQPERDMAQYTRLLDRPAIDMGAFWSLSFDSGAAITAVSKDRADHIVQGLAGMVTRPAPCVGALRFFVDDLGTLADLFKRNQVAFKRVPGQQLLVGPQSAHGVALVFCAN